MGLVTCKQEREAELQNRQIDTQIRIENQANKRKIKMLLLGVTDSGKSTIVKQMRVNYLDGFNETEVVNAIFVIRNNIIDAFKNICNIILHSDITVTQEEKVLVKLFAYESGKIELMQEVDELNVINAVSGYECIKQFFERFAFHPMVPDHIHYFYPNLDRIASSNYVPTAEDLIHMRQTTLGVHEISFDYTKHIIRLIDVGGQKTERRKWIHFFEGVTAVMFVCSLASFNQTTEEEPKAFVWESSLNKVQNKVLVRSAGKAKVEKPGLINRLDESVDLFKSIRENSFLKMSNFMLFLNKKDLLTKKLTKVVFSDYFPDYKKWITNDNSDVSVAEFIENMFREGLEPEKRMYAHLTQATVTANIEGTFALCCDVIFGKNYEDTNLE
ncbi:Guanine nucleotide-binding protein alpha-5 subunit [Caenorhabditis elegans]|uniref:Guanine nucleotide-binding protein alpha-5 subunit n=1 Tax=Caenorhabditis elegans TaxID=6239 RepID=GPA5_CAEEL|nr:Guanine nucleotide-binding protein alpha-5 subunit [Caenorhabditis elegans]Q20701.1 RecName: Full=Guanine nucleotide-binding protein alpha-5 subunit [Caenorhabditis elegans]AAG32081.1 heterotrimeric G protein alpha subunit [Caenorhabditis elegans]CCD68830.1 Guanine nucleotide-binding protein alpha-5 subunit [Caenorhabditis elegans]|eukprot:NP_508393.1 Guanine nucleotide-binding protein alpha-5 subunit [Caenorhabditis elegans]